MAKIDMDEWDKIPKKNGDKMDGQTALFYVLAALTMLLLIYAFGGVILLALPWLGLKAMLG